MKELQNQWNYHSQVFDNEDGTFKLVTGVGHKNYKDNGVYKPIDLTLEDMGTYWRLQKASYKFFIAKDFAADSMYLAPSIDHITVV